MHVEPTEANTARLRRLTGILGVVYVLLYVASNFATGFGDAFFGGHAPAEIVAWAVQHEGTLRLSVVIDLFNDFLFVALAVAWVALTRPRR